RFGYDPEKAAMAESREKAQRKKQADAEAAALADAQRAQDLQRIKKETEGTATIIWARVIQRIGNNLLIDTDSERARLPLPKIEAHHTGKVPNLATGIILLTDYPGASAKVDDDVFAVVGYPIGTYEYTAVAGGRKTIRKYTYNLDLAAEHARLVAEARA